MRVIVLVKATNDSETGAMPSTELLEAMGKYNEELVNASITPAFTSLEGMVPASLSAVAFTRTITRICLTPPWTEARIDLFEP